MINLRLPRTTLAVIAALIYSPTLFFGWVFLDDILIVQKAAFFTKLGNIPAAFLRSVWDPAGQEYNFYRPASTAVYILGGWLSQNLAGEIQPWVFHLTNLLLLAALVPLLFIFFRRLGASTIAAAVATLLMVLHPLAAGTVSWIGGQNELLLAIWSLCTFIAYLNAYSSRLWLVAHGFFLLLALLTKENAVVLPILCAVHLLFTMCSPRFLLLSLFTWGSTALIWFLMIRQGGGESGPDAMRALFAVWEGIPFTLVYLGKWILPLGLSTLPIPEDTAWYIWAAGGLFASGLLAVVVSRFKERPLALLGIFWFLGFLLPTFANIIPEQKHVYILRADRAFLASLGILIVLLQVNWTSLHRPKIKIAAGALAALLLGLNLLHQFNFLDAEHFYESAVRGSPHSPFAHTHYGDVFLMKKDYPRAVEEYKEALRLNPLERRTHNNLGVVYLRMGRVDEALEEFKKDIEITPNSLLAWPNLGLIYLDRANYPAAELAFRRTVEINPSFKDGWAGLIRVYTATRQEQKRLEAEQMMKQAELDMKSGL